MQQANDVSISDGLGRPGPSPRRRRIGPVEAQVPADPMPDISGVLDAVPLPVVVVDSSGIALVANRALRSLLGLEGEQVGRRARFLSRAPGWQRVWQVIAGGPKPTATRVAYEGEGGECRHFDVHVAGTGGRGTVVVTLEDRTALRTLRQRAAAQTAALTAARAQLRAAREEMTRANVSMAELIAELEETSNHATARHRDG